MKKTALRFRGVSVCAALVLIFSPYSQAQIDDADPPENVVAVPTQEGLFCGQHISYFGNTVYHVQISSSIAYGTVGPDVLIGTPNDDQIVGRGGDDCIFGMDGDDILIGSADNDTIFGGNGNDQLLGETGADYLSGQRGFDTYDGGVEPDSDGGDSDQDPPGDGENPVEDQDPLDNGRSAIVDDQDPEIDDRDPILDICVPHDQDTSFSQCDQLIVREFPVVHAAGDLACIPPSDGSPSGYNSGRICVEGFVSGLAETRSPDAFLPLGDLQYGVEDPLNWQQGYGTTWGRLYDVTYPTRGDGETHTAQQAAYAAYFGSRFNVIRPQAINIDGEIDRGSYSFEFGDWHIVSLDLSTDLDWLDADLTAASASCKLAMKHMPVSSSGVNFDGDAYLRGLIGNPWSVLNQHKVAAVLSGDDHHYERFLPQIVTQVEPQPDGENWLATIDRDGTVQFVVGTGGQNLRGLPNQHPNTAVDHPNGRAVSNQHTGFLELELHADHADFRFIAYEHNAPSPETIMTPISGYLVEHEGTMIHPPVGSFVFDEGTIDCNTLSNGR